MNQVSLIGRITRDPEIREGSNGNKFVGFTLAVNEFRNGQEHTNFIPCIAWDRNAENMAKFVKKGALLAVMGRISVRENNDNGVRSSIVNVNADRVDFLESRSNNNETVSFEKKDSNFDMDQVNAFTPKVEAQPVQPQTNKDEETISNDDSILWD